MRLYAPVILYQIIKGLKMLKIMRLVLGFVLFCSTTLSPMPRDVAPASIAASADEISNDDAFSLLKERVVVLCYHLLTGDIPARCSLRAHNYVEMYKPWLGSMVLMGLPQGLSVPKIVQEISGKLKNEAGNIVKDLRDRGVTVLEWTDIPKVPTCVDSNEVQVLQELISKIGSITAPTA